MDRSKLYSIHRFAEICNVSAQTLRNWDKNGKLKPFSTNKAGYRYYSQEQLNQVLGLKGVEIPKKIIGYCRVSSSKQKDDLDRQIDNMKTYLLAQGQPFEIISDIGSGINYDKKGLNQLLEMIVNHEVEKVVILYKDTLVRFGFELIKKIASMYNCPIEIIDNSKKFEEQELVEDLVQIITVFSCKSRGKLANKTKQMIKELTEGDLND